MKVGGSISTYGQFSNQGDEFSINRPDTPRPWFNFLTNKNYSLYIAATGESYSFLTTEYGQLDVTQPIELTSVLARQFGRYVYIRDNDSGEFWTPLWRPSQNPLERFEARHALGYTTVESSKDGLDCSLTFFVPTDEACELWQLKIGNSTSKKRRLSVFVVSHWPTSSETQTTIFQDNAILSAPTKPTEAGCVVRFMTTDKAVDSFDCSLESFIGRTGSLASPQAVVDGKCSRSVAEGETAVGVLQRTVTLGAHSETGFTVILGATVASEPSLAVREAKRISRKYRDHRSVQEVLEQSKQNLEKTLSQTLLRTPENVINSSGNYWLKYQTIVGAATRTNNPASQLEQLFLQVSLNSTETKKELLNYFAYQYSDGRLAKRFEPTARPTDDLLGLVWLLLASISYLKESGDLKLLERVVDYRDSGQAPILEYLVRAVARIDKVLDQDYPDALVYCLFSYCLKELPAIFSASGEHDLIRHYTNLQKELAHTFQRRFWQSGHYRVALGAPKDNLDLETQLWAILGGLASPNHGKKALQLAQKRLASSLGVENSNNPSAVIKSKLTALLAIASTKVGDRDGAYQRFYQSLPMRSNLNSELYRGEPFVVAEGVRGKKSLKKGEALKPWDNQAAGWSYTYIIEYLLGIKPVIGGLKIEPSLPRDWRQVDLTREFRGAQYQIRIQNPLRSSKGVDRIIVDGLRIAGNVVRPFSAGSHFVEVILS